MPSARSPGRAGAPRGQAVRRPRAAALLYAGASRRNRGRRGRRASLSWAGERRARAGGWGRRRGGVGRSRGRRPQSARAGRCTAAPGMPSTADPPALVKAAGFEWCVRAGRRRRRRPRGAVIAAAPPPPVGQDAGAPLRVWMGRLMRADRRAERARRGRGRKRGRCGSFKCAHLLACARALRRRRTDGGDVDGKDSGAPRSPARAPRAMRATHRRAGYAWGASAFALGLVSRRPPLLIRNPPC